VAGLARDDINRARLIREILPISLEVSNGMGASQLTIDPSPKVVQTLGACGGDEALLSAEAVARQAELRSQADEEQRAEDAQAAERVAQRDAQIAEQAERDKQAIDAALAETRDHCRRYGVSLRYGSGANVDCDSDFPAEVGAFNEAIDAIFAVPTKHGILCASRGTRADLVNLANQHGLDAAGSYVQQNWCGNLIKIDRPAD
jgi:hypothetical protein